ncbi:FHA domain-containing protein [Actinosynnema sp. CS-041913]|uniref:FHA domain-containing protein n=1 Tax=Actinosynnema sp. CS-041913 TaxID=3239917 RepID=UPI003D8AE66E
MTVYTPGAAVAVVADGTWLLLGVAPGSGVVRRCWALVRDGAGLDDVVRVIAEEGDRAVGSFALVRWSEAERRVVLRGDAVVGVVGPDGVLLELRDDRVAAWVDTGLPDVVAELRLAVGVGGGAELPVERGVVLACRLAARLADVPAVVSPVLAEPVLAEAVAVAVDPVPAVVEPVSVPVVVPEPVAVEPVSVVAEGVTAVIAMPSPAEGVTTVISVPSPEVDETMLRRNSSPEDTRHVTAGTPKVRAIACPARHLNPEHAVACRVCGQRLAPQEAFVAPRPLLGILRLSTGEVVPLDRGVVLGRDPQVADRGLRAIRFANHGNDISRSHVEVRLNGWDVLVVDLGSKNGTTVIAPGWSPQALAGLIPAILAPGSRVMLGEGAFFTYDVTA